MSKTIILMRHGHYVDAADARAFRFGEVEMLTPQGRKDIDDVAQQMAEAGHVPDVIVYSPAPRTAEAALRIRDVFQQASGRDIPLISDINLAEGHGHAGMKIFEHPVCLDATMVLAVSHEPNIAVFSQTLGKMIYAEKSQAMIFSSEVNDWQEIEKSKPKAIFTPRPT